MLLRNALNLSAVASIVLTFCTTSALAQNTCTNPSIRREWSSVSQATRQSYIDAVFCLTKQPSKLGLATSRFDDFTWVHRYLFDEIHFHGPEILAQFFPWHRYYNHLYEQELKACGYTGAMLYWNWAKDAADPFNAPIFSDTVGIGGDGVQSRACVYLRGLPQRCLASGPFARLRPAYYQGQTYPHSVHRCFTCSHPTMMNHTYTQAVLDSLLAVPGFSAFGRGVYLGPHMSIHQAIGGDFPQTTSPNDPIFFMHHVMVDRMWWKWQQADLRNRQYQYEGQNVIKQAGGTSAPTRAATTDMMHMLGLVKDLPVMDVMNTEGGLLCYRYDD